MIDATPVVDDPPPALRRLMALAPLDHAALEALDAAVALAQPVRARRELLTEGREIVEPRMIVSGWAARVRLLVDGRRQFLSFLLPGDLIGLCRQPRPVAVSTVVALTEVTTCPLPPVEASPTLDAAYAISHALDEAYLLAQITRLGRLNAQERIADLLLEIYERLSLVGLAANGSFAVALTQEILADALGLTPVHINRMLQLARREGDVEWKAGRVVLRHPDLLARKIGRAVVRVSAEPAPVA